MSTRSTSLNKSAIGYVETDCDDLGEFGTGWFAGVASGLLPTDRSGAEAPTAPWEQLREFPSNAE